MYITERLITLKDQDYQKFQSKLLPTIDSKTVIGVRTPVLRGLARELCGTKEAADFLQKLPHTFYEENNLHAFLVEQISEFDACIEAVEAFLPYVDNWATCDGLNPKTFGRNKDALLKHIRCWLKSDEVYTVRFAVGMLLRYYLDEAFREEYLKLAANACCGEYYVNMMVAWYFATALVKQYESAVEYLEKRKLPAWVHNKTIQKAVESYRIPPVQKEYLRTLRMKKEK